MRNILMITLCFYMSSCFGDKLQRENCFSESNFEIIYQYLESKKVLCYPLDEYEVYLGNETEIFIKKGGGSIAKISKKTGVMALAKYVSDNEKQLVIANKIICQLVEETEI